MHTYIHTYICILSLIHTYLYAYTYLRRSTLYHRNLPARRISVSISIVGRILRSIPYNRRQRLVALMQVICMTSMNVCTVWMNEYTCTYVCMYVCMYVCKSTFIQFPALYGFSAPLRMWRCIWSCICRCWGMWWRGWPQAERAIRPRKPASRSQARPRHTPSFCMYVCMYVCTNLQFISIQTHTYMRS